MLRRTLIKSLTIVGGFMATPMARNVRAQDAAATPTSGGTAVTNNASTTGYAPVNDLQMYYEVHGSGRPLLLLHGAYMTIEGSADLLAGLAETRQVVAVETQGHGRTADVDRPLSYTQMADDCAALLAHLGVAQADVFGFSMGGGIALQLAIRHPELVRRQVIVSASFRSDGVYPEIIAQIATITPEVMAETPFAAAYLAVAPRPENFPTLVEKLVTLDGETYDWTADMASITVPTLIVVGDADAVQPEHAVEMLRILGGGIIGEAEGSPKAQLAILPNTSHIGMLDRANELLAIVPDFLDAAEPEATPAAEGA
jgi:pimeloyl-ACP methyl ester carboxylesterase